MSSRIHFLVFSACQKIWHEMWKWPISFWQTAFLPRCQWAREVRGGIATGHCLHRELGRDCLGHAPKQTIPMYTGRINTFDNFETLPRCSQPWWLLLQRQLPCRHDHLHQGGQWHLPIVDGEEEEKLCQRHEDRPQVRPAAELRLHGCQEKTAHWYIGENHSSFSENDTGYYTNPLERP